MIEIDNEGFFCTSQDHVREWRVNRTPCRSPTVWTNDCHFARTCGGYLPWSSRYYSKLTDWEAAGEGRDRRGGELYVRRAGGVLTCPHASFILCKAPADWATTPTGTVWSHHPVKQHYCTISYCIYYYTVNYNYVTIFFWNTSNIYVYSIFA